MKFPLWPNAERRMPTIEDPVTSWARAPCTPMRHHHHVRGTPSRMHRPGMSTIDVRFLSWALGAGRSRLSATSHQSPAISHHCPFAQYSPTIHVPLTPNNPALPPVESLS